MEEEKKKRPFLSAMGKFMVVVGGFVLPLAALIVGLMIGDGCSSSPFGVMPTPLHVAMVAFVPVANFAIWMCLRRGIGAESRLLRATCGLSVGICAVYALALLPMAFFGAVACVMAFWYFGVGFLGLLPGAPLAAFVVGLVFRRRLAKAAESRGLGHVGGFKRGLFAAAALWAAVFGGEIATVSACRQGVSGDLATSARGVGYLRSFGRDDILERFCRDTSLAPMFESWRFGSRRSSAKDAPSQDARDMLYYRVTGEDPAFLHAWRGRRGRPFFWDSLVGGEKVGGEVEGLSLKGSAYDTTVDKTAGVGYCEWTMTFANSRKWGEAEARCRIALPPGGVVSRLTLWVHGEESEAAFGTRGQVRRAYESVVRSRRDPVLVNVCGPDQVQLQCFPVPHEGEMKVRLGITVPLDVAADGKSARFPAPAIVTRNFAVPGDLVGLPSVESVAFERPPAAFASFADESREEIKGSAILQKASSGPGWRPSRVAFVIDTSAAMKPHIANVISAIDGKMPAGIATEFWMLDDMPPDEPAAKLPKLAPPCAGGRPVLRTLVKALDSLSARPEPSALVWIHAGAPVAGQSGDAFALRLRKAQNTRLFLCQVYVGECALVEPIPPSASVVSLNADAALCGAGPALERLLASWGSDVWRAERKKVPLAEVPASAVPASENVARLWAAEETSRVFRTGDPVRLGTAQKTALPWHIVTAATGAVVLETQEQFKANGLEQVEASKVPTVPEPESLLCLAVVAIVFAAVLFFMRRRRAVA